MGKRRTLFCLIAGAVISASPARSNPYLPRADKGIAALAKVLNISDQEVLQSAYDAYAKALVNRRLLVPLNAVVQAVESAREDDAQLRKQAAQIVDNSFAENSETGGFLKELRGGQL